MRRVQTPVTLAEARSRLEAYRKQHGVGPHGAQWLAHAIWPDTKWLAAQGAGAAATRVLKRLGCYWLSTREARPRHGWMIVFNK